MSVAKRTCFIDSSLLDVTGTILTILNTLIPKPMILVFHNYEYETTQHRVHGAWVTLNDLSQSFDCLHELRKFL